MNKAKFQGRQIYQIYWSHCSRTGMAALATLGTLSSVWATSTLPAQAQRTNLFDLDRAICANNWRDAVGIVGTLIAQDETTGAQRTALLAMRRQLEGYRSENTIVADEQACDRTDPYLLQAAQPGTVQTGKPLGWEAAVAEATDHQYSTEVITEAARLTLPVTLGEPAGLTPAAPIDLSNGLNVVSGHVGTGHEVYAFVAGLGDRLEANLEVTRVMAGSLYTSDDSQLFIFDRDGNLVASADDSSDQRQSRLNNVVIPKTDLYFAVVTSYNNDPIMNQAGRLSGWQDNGGGRFDYTLSLSGVTPTSALAR